MVTYVLTDNGYELYANGELWLIRTKEQLESIPGDTLDEKAKYDIDHLPDGPGITVYIDPDEGEDNEEIIFQAELVPTLAEKLAMYEEALRLLGVEV